jgi:excinuclease ABC subunit A
VIDMGPRAGVLGGEVIAFGKPEDLIANPQSITGKYLSGEEEIAIPEKRRWADKKKMIRVIGATGNNLKDVTAEIPLGVFTCITGVSGGGKSTLVVETLYKALARRLNGASDAPAPHKKIEGIEHLDKIIDIDQSPIGRTPRSNPATYTGAFTPLREWFAGLPEAKARGYGPGRFSFNVAGGRCEACEGAGVLTIEMHFLPDVLVTCEVCQGRRYDRETLAVRYKGMSIADVLALTVAEALDLMGAVPAIRSRLDVLREVGLDYLTLGQSGTTLSGGEAQRVRLARELAKRATGRTLYVLDEPTTGLHFEDVRRLLDVLGRLVDAGNTVLLIEHNLDVIRAADHVIDLGPGGGEAGGRIVAAGTPEDIARCAASATGAFLKGLASGRSSRVAGA